MTGPRVRRRWPRRGNEADRRYDQIGKLAVISDLDCHSRGSRLEKGRDYEHPTTVGSIFGAGDLRQISYGLKVLF